MTVVKIVESIHDYVSKGNISTHLRYFQIGSSPNLGHSPSFPHLLPFLPTCSPYRSTTLITVPVKVRYREPLGGGASLEESHGGLVTNLIFRQRTRAQHVQNSAWTAAREWGDTSVVKGLSSSNVQLMVEELLESFLESASRTICRYAR